MGGQVVFLGPAVNVMQFIQNKASSWLKLPRHLDIKTQKCLPCHATNKLSGYGRDINVHPQRSDHPLTPEEISGLQPNVARQVRVSLLSESHKNAAPGMLLSQSPKSGAPKAWAR